MNKPQMFTVVVRTLSSDKRFSHYGVIFENENVSLSGAYKTDNYHVTEFQSEKETNPVVFNILANRESFLKSIPNYKEVSDIQVQICSHVDSLFRAVYVIKL